VPPAQTLDQSSELHEIRYAEERALLAYDDLGIGDNEIGPLRGHRAHGLVIDLEQKTPSKAVNPLAHAGELPPAEGVERVSDPHKAR
jgi:hypothetical protein